MKDYWIFPTLTVAILIGTYFESRLFLILFVPLIIRILVLKNKNLDLVILMILGIFFVRFQMMNQNISLPELRTATFAADEIAVNGDVLSGELQSSGQHFRFIYQIKTHSEQEKWQKMSSLAQGEIKVDKMEPIKGPRNQGEFDYRKYLEHKGIHSSLYLSQIGPLQSYQPKNIFEKIKVLRIHLISYLSTLPKWLKIHAQSLLVGYTANSEKSFLNILSVLGVIHLFSLSGLHVLILLTLLRKLTSLLRIPVELIDTILLFLLPCYGLLVGSKSGIWRAIVLAVVGIICRKFELSISRLDLFSLTMLICLLIYPYGVLEMGGQLSFLLSFAILYLYQKTNTYLATFKMLLVSLPLILFYTFQFNWLTLAINLIFVPIFTFLILPITILSALSVNWSFWLTINLFFEKFYQFLDKIATNQNLIFVTGSIPIFIVVILIVEVLFYVETRTFWNKYLWQYMIILISCILLNKFPLFGTVTLIDVGQGDSILITTPLARKVFLIDVAGKLKFPKPQWAKHESNNQVDNSTIPLLKSRGISYVDKLFLTHKDVDHVGNLETILTKFKVKEVNIGLGLEENPRLKQAMIKHSQVKFKNLRQGDAFTTGTINWQVLWPKTKGIGENGDSLTLLAKIKNKRWLFTGDLDQDSEKKILENYRFRIDYLKVGHHGSKTATSDQLLDVSKPKIGFISAGVNNRYGHPNKETLKRLNDHRVKYLNTAEYGMISWYYYFFNDDEKITTFLKGDLVENNGTKK